MPARKLASPTCVNETNQLAQYPSHKRTRRNHKANIKRCSKTMAPAHPIAAAKDMTATCCMGDPVKNFAFVSDTLALP
jgi:hypothetical protein